MDNMASFKAMLFDLDGTLADTFPDLVLALEETFREAGRIGLNESLSTDRLRPFVSKGARSMVAAAASESDSDIIEALHDRFLALYLEGIARKTRLYAGIAPLLEWLEGQGLAWGVVTNKLFAPSLRLLTALGLEQRAACIVGGDSAAHAKPHPDPMLLACERISIPPEAIVFVGDARTDIEAGRSVGALTVSAGWGYLDPADPPSGWGADIHVDSPHELLDQVKRERFASPE